MVSVLKRHQTIFRALENGLLSLFKGNLPAGKTDGGSLSQHYRNVKQRGGSGDERKENIYGVYLGSRIVDEFHEGEFFYKRNQGQLEKSLFQKNVCHFFFKSHLLISLDQIYPSILFKGEFQIIQVIFQLILKCNASYLTFPKTLMRLRKF